jgi:hypothetical protein
MHSYLLSYLVLYECELWTCDGSDGIEVNMMKLSLRLASMVILSAHSFPASLTHSHIVVYKID